MKRLAFLIVILGAAVALGYLGWRWVDGATVQTVRVRGAVYADSAQVVELAGVSVGDPLLEVPADIIADRVRRHPWVRHATVSRQPTGTVVISLHEREPVALALDRAGRPAYYLDAEGHRMPAEVWAGLDIPIVRGIAEPYHPVRPLQNPSLKEFLALLVDMEDVQNALLSEIHETRAGLELYTAVSPAGQSIRVRLGSEHFDEKLDRLQAFWMQSVLRRPTITYDWVDLRFEGRIVTRERA